MVKPGRSQDSTRLIRSSSPPREEIRPPHPDEGVQLRLARLESGLTLALRQVANLNAQVRRLEDDGGAAALPPKELGLALEAYFLGRQK